jgi:hypothetical protein
MKTLKTITMLLTIATLVSTTAAFAQEVEVTKTKSEKAMKKSMNTYVIERQIPNAGNLDAEELRGISQKSCSVLRELGPNIEWVQSYVAGDKIYCIYRAENEEILKVHAERGGFPINSVSKVSTVISPATASAPLAEIMNQNSN